MQRHQPLCYGHFRKVPDAPQMVRAAQRHDAAAVRVRTLQGQLHRLHADHLAVTPIPVQRQHRADVHGNRGRGVRHQAALTYRIHVPGHHAHTVRIVAAQIGQHQVRCDLVCLLWRAARADKDAGHHVAQGSGGDRLAYRACHGVKGGW